MSENEVGEALNKLRLELKPVPRLAELVDVVRERMGELREENGELRDALDRARDVDRESLEELLELIADFGRGVRGLDEVIEKARLLGAAVT